MSFLPVYIGILLAGTILLNQRFGIYFMQFGSWKRTFLNLASWAVGTPKNELDEFDPEAEEDLAHTLEGARR